jgi:hypothetical protein
VVTISAPPDGTIVDEGQPVTLTGSATDAEDGDISASLVWSSDLDGALGSGASVGAVTLAPGLHTITASVTDSSGLPASTQIMLMVGIDARILLSVATTVTLDGLTFQDDDVVEYDLLTGAVNPNLIFEGTHQTLEDIDGVSVLPNGLLLLSVTGSATYPTESGGIFFRDGDIVEFDPLTGFASDTLFFDEDAFGADVDIDAFHVEGSKMVFSTRSDFLSFQDDDLIEYDFGTGMFSLFFDGASPFGFSTTSEDILSHGVDDSGRILLSTLTAAIVGSNGLAFETGDLVAIDLGTGVATIIFRGSVLLRDPNDPSQPAGVRLNAVHYLVAPNPPTPVPVLSSWRPVLLVGALLAAALLALRHRRTAAR